MKKLDLVGQQFGSLTVIREHSKSRTGLIKYLCQCRCGKETSVFSTHLIQGNTKSCGCLRPIGKMRKDWTGCGEISGGFWWNHIVRSANGDKGRRSPVPLEITICEAWDLFLYQDRKCALSGVPLAFPIKHKDKGWTASLDRIDSCKGYLRDNIRWVHKDINMLKRTFDNNYFIHLCKQVANNNL